MQPVNLRRSWLFAGVLLASAVLLLAQLWRPSARLQRAPKAERWFRTPNGAPIALDEPPSSAPVR